MSLFITLYRGRATTETVTISDAAGDDVEFEAGDVARLKIGRAGAAPILDLDSAAASANGTTVEKANPFEVEFAAADVSLLEPGVYQAEASIVDASDGGKIKHADAGVCVVHNTLLGDVGAE